MSLVSWFAFSICAAIILSCFRKQADVFSPARLFAMTWSGAIGLADLKLSALQHDWEAASWMILLIGVFAFLVGTFVVYVLHINSPLVPIRDMRNVLRREEVNEKRLFWFVTGSIILYAVTYLGSYLVKGFLPVFAVGSKSRVEFNVYGFGIFINSCAFIIFFTVLYNLLVRGHQSRKRFLVASCVLTVGSYFLLLQRFEVVMAGVVCVAFLYYGTRLIRFRTMFMILAVFIGFFYWIMSLRLGHLVLSFTHVASKMRYSADYAFLTEPYMYVVMNLENFAHAVVSSEFYTFGYFTFDFVVAVTGLKYWILEYFNLNRTPYLTSYYNTYTGLWWFFSDFGVVGVAFFQFLLGTGIATLYYRMRTMPTIANVTWYSVLVFVILISFFVFPIAQLWFVYNMLAFAVILRWTTGPNGKVSSVTA